MMITNYMIEKMGFIEQDPPKIITCKFYELKIYSLTAINFQDTDEVRIIKINDKCNFGIGNDINKICLCLTKNQIIENQEEWEKEKKTHGPFLLTLTSDDIEYKANCKWYQEKDGDIITYNCFDDGRINLKLTIDNYEIPYIPAITSRLSIKNYLVKTIFIENHRYGMTDDGKFLHDIKFEGSAEAHVSRKISIDDAFELISNQIENYYLPNERTTRLFYTSMQEKDKLKTFLFAWTGFEVFINKYFSQYKITEFPKEKTPDEYLELLSILFNDPVREYRITTIAHKYLYLTIFDWKFLSISDYDDFMKIKKFRDNFTHGENLNMNIANQYSTVILELFNKIIVEINVNNPKTTSA